MLAPIRFTLWVSTELVETTFVFGSFNNSEYAIAACCSKSAALTPKVFTLRPVNGTTDVVQDETVNNAATLIMSILFIF
ncbi:hypothetical protein D9M68_555310 [compost metagenome]